MVIVCHNSLITYDEFWSGTQGEIPGNQVRRNVTEESPKDALGEVETQVRKSLCINVELCLTRG